MKKLKSLKATTKVDFATYLGVIAARSEERRVGKEC